MTKAIIEKISVQMPTMGVYPRTEIDGKKEAADIRIVGPIGSKWEIFSKQDLSGRGISLSHIRTDGTFMFRVTETALNGLQSKFSIATDF
jgi:hypothetical protein